MSREKKDCGGVLLTFDKEPYVCSKSKGHKGKHAQWRKWTYDGQGRLFEW